MRTSFSYFLRVCLRFIQLSDLLENLYDSKDQALFQSRLTGFENRFPVIVPITSRTVFSIGLVEQLLQVQYFTNLLPSAELTGVQQVFF
jgi:hypothetical protein